MLYRVILPAGIAIIVTNALLADQKTDADDKEDRAGVFAAVRNPEIQLKDYHRWRMLTNGAVTTTKNQYFACEPYSFEARDKLREDQGPHWAGAVRVYANSVASTAVDSDTRPFPVGSIIVKEKIYQHKIEAVTAVIKKPDSYDSTESNNDWQYVYFQRTGDLQVGKIQSCRKCHQKAGKNDFQFLKYPDAPGYSSMWGDSEGPYLK